MKKTARFLTLLLLLSLLVSVIPPPAAKAAAVKPDRIPDEMWDNIGLRALAYIGYDVDALKEKGKLYDYDYTSYGIRDQSDMEDVLSGIPYGGDDCTATGRNDIPDSSTPTGRAPNVKGTAEGDYYEDSFMATGLVCSSFVGYYLFNYVKNIEDIDTSSLYDDYFSAADLKTYRTEDWSEALTAAAENVETTGVVKYTNEEEGWANLVPGDIVIFTKENKPSKYKHIAIYAGACDMYRDGRNTGLRHYIIHVGNDRGPEISTSEYQKNEDPDKSGIPTEFYHLGGITAPLPEPEPELGGFIVQKESNSLYTSQFFKFNLWRVEEDESRTHIGEYSICAGDPLSFGSNKKVFEDLPVGQYVIQEDQTPVDGWTLDSTYHYITATPYDPDTYYEGYPTVTLTNTLANDGGMSIKVTKQTNTGTGADRGWTVKLYFMGPSDYEWRLIGTKTTAQDAADPSCTFLLTEEELWALTDASSNSYQVTGQFMVMEDQTPVDGWIIDSSQYIFDAKLGGSYTATFTNSACGSMTVTKVGYGGEPISGSTMLLEWSTNGTGGRGRTTVPHTSGNVGQYHTADWKKL